VLWACSEEDTQSHHIPPASRLLFVLFVFCRFLVTVHSFFALAPQELNIHRVMGWLCSSVGYSQHLFPDFRRGIKIVRKSLFYKGEVADLGVPRVKWGNVRSKKEEQIRLHQRSGYR